ncbi:MAG: hypothetical protein J6031_02390 [Bacteroidales bacterium]|nr:hypothetical protein [Bacteroidales bacterium]
MNKKKNNSEPFASPDSAPLHDDEPMQQLKRAWVKQHRKTDSTLNAAPSPVDFARLEVQRQRTAAPFLVLGIVCTLLAVATLLLRAHTADSGLRIAAIALAAICAAAAVFSLMHFVSLYWHNTAAAQFPEFNTAQITLISIVALFALAYTTSRPVGDGYTITLNSHSRTEVINSINNLFC